MTLTTSLHSKYGSPILTSLPSGWCVPDWRWVAKNTNFVSLPSDWNDGNPDGDHILIHLDASVSLFAVLEVIEQSPTRYPVNQIYGLSMRHKMCDPSRDLSAHSYGFAIDINWNTNPVGHRGDIPDWVIAAFEVHDWVWGGRWSVPDPMHFEYRGDT